MNNELIDRYLYDVVRRLPEKQRADIEKELRTLIEDMAEEKSAGGVVTEDIIKQVLTELGAPAKLAAKYRENGNCLIGGAYYTLYCQVLKIVMICVGAGLLVAYSISFFVTTVADSVGEFVNVATDKFIDLFSIPSVLIEVFGWITLIFFLMERNQVNIDNKRMAKEWSLNDLPAVPHKKAIISRGESLFGIVAGVLLIILFVAAPQAVGVWLKADGGSMITVPLFNPEVYSYACPLIVISLLVGIMNNVVKLVYGRYNLPVMVSSIINSCASIGIGFLIFKGCQIWNENFVPVIMKVSNRTFDANYDIISHWNQIIADGKLSNIIMIIIIVGSVVEILVTMYHTVRYATRGIE